MIQKLNIDQIPDYEKACKLQPIFGAKNMASLRCYGLDSSDAAFYIGYNGSNINAAICVQGGVAAISSDKSIDPEELHNFIVSENIKEVEGSLEDVDKVLEKYGGEFDSSWFMEYLPKTCPAPQFSMRKCNTLKEVFDVLQRSHKFYQDHYTYETWSKDVQCRLDHSETEEYVLEIDGEIIGCGSIGAFDDEVATVSSIAVIPEKRCNGYGSAITIFLVQRILEMGRKPVLIAGYDEVSELYLELGFNRCGKWGELYI